MIQESTGKFRIEARGAGLQMKKVDSNAGEKLLVI
jgi:hypothetical protein